MRTVPSWLGALLTYGLTMSVDIAEFVRIVRSTDDELRDRFALPAQCDPVVSAVRKPGNKVRVFITCLAESRGIRSAPRAHP